MTLTGNVVLAIGDAMAVLVEDPKLGIAKGIFYGLELAGLDRQFAADVVAATPPEIQAALDRLDILDHAALLLEGGQEQLVLPYLTRFSQRMYFIASEMDTKTPEPSDLIRSGFLTGVAESLRRPDIAKSVLGLLSEAARSECREVAQVILSVKLLVTH